MGKLRPASETDMPFAIPLIVESDHTHFQRAFGKNTVKGIEKLIRKDSPLALDYLRIFEVKERAVGLCALYTHSQMERLSKARLWSLKFTEFSLTPAVIFEFLSLRDCMKMSVDEDQTYLGILAIESEYRGKGFGKQLLFQLLGELSQSVVSELVLDVARNNWRAIKFYRSCRFKVESSLPVNYPLEKSMRLKRDTQLTPLEKSFYSIYD